MKKPLCIVESSSKCPKIISYLNNKYDCVATGGHICEIAGGLNSLNLDDVLKTKFKSKRCTKLKEAIKSHDEIILATDNDREGEAIAWHICRIFKLDISKTKRMLFNEITQPAIQFAVNNTTLIDMNMVKSQITRQIVDILVGFKISPLLWKNISSKDTLSAGRCQTPTLMILEERETRIRNSPVEVIYSTEGFFTSKHIKFHLNKHIEETDIDDFYKQSLEIVYMLSLSPVTESELKSPYPLITSTLQQHMSNVFGYSPKKTMTIAQTLYQKGFITYMRTDSSSYSPEFTQTCSEYISEKYGDTYIGKPRTKKVKNAQEAHEAIRPTNIYMTGDSLPPEEKKIYNEIYKITLQSCMSHAIQIGYNCKINAPQDTFYQRRFIKTTFRGWKILSQEKEEFYDYVLNLKPSTKCRMVQSKLELQNKVPHYTESQLIKRIEEVGIGRPSTYASLIEKIKERNYVEKRNVNGVFIDGYEYSITNNIINKENVKKTIGEQKNKIVLTTLGNEVINYTNRHFNSIFNYEFTADLENKLDNILSNSILPESLCTDYLQLIDKNIPKETTDYEIEPGYIFKTGVYGPYIKNGEKNIKLKPGITLDKIINNNLSLDDIIHKETGIIVLTESLSLRIGKYGWYIFYKTQTMHRPQFYTLKKYNFDENNYDKNDIMKWINNTYNIYG